MKNPNGYGSISKVKRKNLRKPYQVRITTNITIDENGKKHQHKKCIGYFETKEEALNALTNYHNNHGLYEFKDLKFIDLWNKWQETKEIQDLSASRQKGYTSTINAIPDNLKNAKFITLKYQHWQDFINNLKVDKGYSTIKRIRGDISQLYDYAMKNEIIDKNYGRMVELGKSPKKGEAKIFTDEQIRKMYNVLYYNQANEEAIFTIKTVLMLIYNGCRISEFLSLKTADVNLSEQYFEIKEAKTEAGIRKVPIHKCMLRYYQDFYDSNNEYLLTNPKTKKKYSYANYRDSYFDRLKIELEWDEDITPHNARKTCASLLKKYGVDATYQKLIIGHEGALDLTERTYTYIDVEQLVEAINQIPSVDTL